MRVLFFLYGLFIYVFFLGTFLYTMGFIEGVVVPKSINTGAEESLGMAMLINILMLGVFGIQHSIMARPAFKKHWTRLIPEPVERSTFVLFTCIILAVMFWQWRPITSTIWSVDQQAARMFLIGLSYSGWLLVLYSTFLIDHFDLFGLRQVVLYLRGIEYTQKPFMERSAYKLIRHPLMLGFIIAFWSTPQMTGGHLLFAFVTTAYILVAIRIEEGDLIRELGDDYRQYRERTRMLVPIPKARSTS
jgi:protein-S-isoprenylcysteine O-methyltransferase Ste14